MTVIATGLSSARKAVVQPLQRVVQQKHQHPAMPALRTGSDKLPILNHVSQPGPAVLMQAPRRPFCLAR